VRWILGVLLMLGAAKIIGRSAELHDPLGFVLAAPLVLAALGVMGSWRVRYLWYRITGRWRWPDLP
jgi:hypothetical protein